MSNPSPTEKPSPTIVDSAQALDALLEEGFISPRDLTPARPKWLDQKFLDASPIYSRLRHLKHLYNVHPTTQEQFLIRKMRWCSTAAGQNPLSHMKSYGKALADIDAKSTHIFSGGRVGYFLDIGCSPGGFSNWILQKNEEAVGVGLTLPDEEASWKMIVEGTYLAEPRYEIQFTDIISMVHGCATRDENPIIRPKRQDNSTPAVFDLAQILMMLCNLAPGGIGLVVVNTKTFRWVVEILSILRQSFKKVSSAKGKTLHAQRATCYLVCTGFCGGTEQVKEFGASLRRVLVELEKKGREHSAESADGDKNEGEEDGEPVEEEGSRAEEEGPHESKAAEPHHLFPLSDEELFQAEHVFVLKVFEPMWRLQFNGIYKVFVENLKQECLRHGSKGAKTEVGRPRQISRKDSKSPSSSRTTVPSSPSNPLGAAEKGWRRSGPVLRPGASRQSDWRTRGAESTRSCSSPSVQAAVGEAEDAKASGSWRKVP